MISLYDSSIVDILPAELSDNAKVQALGYAVKKASQRMIDYCKNISIFAVIDTAPEDLLDILALELNTQYYDSGLSVDVKRDLIKKTFVWYMKTGTPASVEEAVVSVFGNGEIEEWFSYDGDPFHFRVKTENINSTDEMMKQLTDIINTMKNVRSHLDEVVIEVMQQLKLYNGCVLESVGDSVTIGIDMDI